MPTYAISLDDWAYANIGVIIEIMKKIRKAVEKNILILFFILFSPTS